MGFTTIWLPSIVCSLGGCLASWYIGWRQGRRSVIADDKHTLMLTNILLLLEQAGLLELVRDQNGNITGGRNFTITLGTGNIRINAPSE